MSSANTQDWQSQAAKKRSQCESLIPAAWKLPSALVQSLAHPIETSKNNLIELDVPRRTGILTEKELHITEAYDVRSLLQALASGELSSLEVTVAYCKRAAIAQQLTSCLTEMFFEQAQERARHLDALRQKGQLVGPLHGLPISIKDCFQVKGVDATLGFVAYLENGPSQENSCLVDVLLSLGAVLFCKTNIPQTMMTADSHNNTFGRALNPWNTSLTAGGSSGGEGSLVAFRGSPLGIGTDVAGSIRIPSLCCGTYGFKPTAGRMPYGKQVPFTTPGLGTILPSAGPLANDVDALEILVKSVIDTKPALVDSAAINVPWRSDVSLKPKLRFGVVAEDPMFPWHPPVKRAVADGAELLRAQGHDVVFLTADECLIGPNYDVSTQLFSMEEAPDRIIARGGEPIVPSILFIHESMRALKFDRDFLLDTRTVDDRLERLSILNVKRSFIQEAWRKLWVEHQLDAVIGPGAQNTAVEHDMYALPPYTCIYNLLNYPACIIPVGRVTNPEPKENFTKSSNQFAPPYNPENLKGAPTALQIATLQMSDEECLAIAKLFDGYLRARTEDAPSVGKL